MNARDASRTPARHALIGAAALLALTLGAACGGGSAADPGASDDDIASLGTAAATPPADSAAPDAAAELDPEEAMLAWVACMREHGVDMPDPQIDSGGEGGGGISFSFERGADDDHETEEEDFAAAAQECDHLLESAYGDFELDPDAEAEMREAMLAYAECMREHGIDMPDPEFGEHGEVTMFFGAEGEPDIDVDAFEAADRACSNDTMSAGYSHDDAEDDE